MRRRNKTSSSLPSRRSQLWSPALRKASWTQSTAWPGIATLLGPTAFASCACQKDQNLDSVSEQIVSQVTNFCSWTGTQDVTSAVEVFSTYCAAVHPKPTPAAIIPPRLATLPSITALSTAVTLPPCATNAIRNAVNGMTYDIPPLADLAEQASCGMLKE